MRAPLTSLVLLVECEDHALRVALEDLHPWLQKSEVDGLVTKGEEFKRRNTEVEVADVIVFCREMAESQRRLTARQCLTET